MEPRSRGKAACVEGKTPAGVVSTRQGEVHSSQAGNPRTGP
jgi:hypothetical protein